MIGDNNTMTIQPLKARTARSTLINNTGPLQLDMFHVVSELLNSILKTYEQTSDSIRQELALMDNQHLHIYEKQNKFYFYSVPKGSRKRTSLSKNMEQVYKLARCAYLENRLSALDTEIKRLRCKLYDTASIQHELKHDRLLKRFDHAGLNLCQILFTKEQNEWINEVYSPNPYKPEGYKYQTAGGVWMRSKSEARIGSALEAIGWPYRNDDLVRIISDESTGGAFHDGPRDMPFRDSYYADFKVPNLLGGITIHEHLGAFQMDAYADNGLKRLNDYHNFTVIELPRRPVTSNEFTWSFESDVTGQDSLNNLIRKMLLPIF